MRGLNTLSKAFCQATLLRLRRWSYPPAIALVLWVIFFRVVGEPVEEPVEEPEVAKACQEITHPQTPRLDLKTYPELTPQVRKLAKVKANNMGLQVHTTTLKRMIALRERYRSRQTPMEIEMDFWREQQRRKWVRERGF